MIEVNKPVEVADGAERGAAAELSRAIPPLKLQPEPERSDATYYHLAELLRYHDRAFVLQAYMALCKRPPPEAELARTLDDLRSGRLSKIDIIAELSAAQPDGRRVQVAGLPSPALRRLSGWPVVGYVLRWLRGLARLPVLVQHQQQFEAYALAQQQQIADYLNEVLLPVVARHEANAPAIAQLSATVADAVESVLMLSDSLIELSSQQAELQTQATDLQTQVQHLVTQQQMQQQTDAQLHADLLALTGALTEQQQRHDELRRAHDATAGAQQEFLVQEQRVIVETQKVALGELQAQLRELAAEQEARRAELATEVRRLRALVAGLRAGANEPANEQAAAPEREQA
ncbi:MAG TPA: hypothetical protein VF525_17450 [Pyrinomonadaceae bacterium]|jgi:hypothetical protein